MTTKQRRTEALYAKYCLAVDADRTFQTEETAEDRRRAFKNLRDVRHEETRNERNVR